MVAPGLPVHEVRAQLVAIETMIVRLVFGKKLQLEEEWAPGDFARWNDCPIAAMDIITNEKFNKLNFLKQSATALHVPVKRTFCHFNAFFTILTREGHHNH